jgi:hypothetical protein
MPVLEDITDTSVVKFECTSANYASLSHNRLFFDPGFYFRIDFRGEKPEKRTSSVYYSHPYIYSSRINYYFPDNYQVEVLPAGAELNRSFGRYSLLVQSEGNRICINRDFQINHKKIR